MRIIFLLAISILLISMTQSTWGQEPGSNKKQIVILNQSASVSGRVIEYSAEYVNNFSIRTSFDAIIRLDTKDEVVDLKAQRVTLRPGESITLSGQFNLPSPGQYVIQWEAISPPPGEQVADRTRVPIVVPDEISFQVLLFAVLGIILVVSISLVTFRYRARIWNKNGRTSI